MIMAMTAEPNSAYGFDRYCVDRRDERLIGPHGPIKLGNKAFQVLLKLIEQGGRLVTKDSLMSSVWDGTIVSEFSLTSAIKELRRALGDDARAPRFIESVYGRGYRFVSRIDIVDAAAGTGAAATAAAAAARAPLGARRPSPLPAGSNDAAPTAGPGDRRGPPGRLRRLRANLVAAAILVSSTMALAPTGLDRFGGGVEATPPAAETRAPAREARLAVLPFENLSDGDKDAQSLRGIEEQVIDQLANAPGLRVTGRTVADVLGTEAGLADARRQLGLTHLLEGSLRAEGATLRVSIRLLRADDGTRIWSDRFDLPGEAGEALARDVGQAVAARVRERFRHAAS